MYNKIRLLYRSHTFELLRGYERYEAIKKKEKNVHLLISILNK